MTRSPFLDSGSGLGRLAVEQATSEGLDPGMDQVAYVRDAVAANPTDFLVRKPVLKLQTENFALVGGKALQESQHARPQFVALGRLERAGGGIQAAADLVFAQLSHAMVLPQNVQ